MALACAILFCGGDSEENPPPSEPSIDGIYEAIEIANADYAPFIDEATAKRQSRILALESELDAANAENDRLSDKVDELKQEISELKKAREAEKNESSTSSSNDVGDSHSSDTSNNSVANGSKGNVGASSSQSFNTSYYGMDCAGCSGITASGLDVSDGTTTYKGMRILAADTSIIPLHSVVIVTNPDGSSYKGIIKDRGGAIKGYKLDVLVGSEAEASNFGRHPAKVEIISKGDNKYRKE